MFRTRLKSRIGDCIKYSIYTLNIFLLLACVMVMVACGVVISVNGHMVELIGLRTTWFLVTLFLLAATLVIVITMLGCLGALRESELLLTFYLYSTMILLVILIVGGSVTYVFNDTVQGQVEIHMIDQMEEYLPGTDSLINSVWDTTQEELQCCGVYSYEDWSKYNIYFNNTSNEDLFPNSCYPLSATAANERYFTTGNQSYSSAKSSHRKIDDSYEDDNENNETNSSVIYGRIIAESIANSIHKDLQDLNYIEDLRIIKSSSEDHVDHVEIKTKYSKYMYEFLQLSSQGARSYSYRVWQAKVFPDGCLDAIKAWFYSNLPVWIGVIIFIPVCLSISICCACQLLTSIETSDKIDNW